MSSGRYLKAPLVYMTATIKTTPLPTLTPDQSTSITQTMIKHRLPFALNSVGQIINLGEMTDPQSSPQMQSFTRYGFFSIDRKECLIFDHLGVEWRTSAYQRYSTLCSRIQEILTALISTVDVFGHVNSQELVLSYADVIAPRPNRKLCDYFADGNSILPLNLIKGGENDFQQVGQVQVTRVLEPLKRIFVSLEQLPVINGEMIRFLPQNMMEGDTNFNMPLHVQPEWKKLDSSHYGLLTTQAAMISIQELKDIDITRTFEPLHIITRQTFKDLLNHDVCNEDWEFKEDLGAQNAS